MAVAAASKYPSVEIDTGDHTPIGEDEVVFVLRARDVCAIKTLMCYKLAAIHHGSPREHIEAVNLSIKQFKEWQDQHQESVKIPD